MRKAVSLGMWLIDTAEFYGAGHAEEVVGMAIEAFDRDEVFVVTKVWHTNLRYNDVIKAAERSLKRLKTDYIDLYLVHWPNPNIPLRETMKAMEKLVEDGMVLYVGVSNFDVSLMEEARSYLSHTDIVANQVKYNLLDRNVEKDVLPYCQEERITLIAYTPLEKGLLANDPFLSEIGKKYGKTSAQVALNWLISKDMVVAIPKAIEMEHIEENAGAMGWQLSEEDMKLIDEKFKGTRG
ncbi:MAG: aldo/keto reductase [Candidatus Asgardarchaeia archaeon]